MDIDVMDSLDDLGYPGTLCDEAALTKAIDEGPKSIDFTHLVAWLSTELQTLCDLESCVHVVTDCEDSTSFLVEVSSFLKELQCPYKCLVEGPIGERLVEKNHRTILLDYLCAELQAARLIKDKTKDEKSSLDIEMEASSTATSLTNLLHELNLDKRVEENPIELLEEAEKKVKELLSSGSVVLPGALIDEELSESQWENISELQKEMHEDYKTRREMLLTRLDVTIQSFKWGETAQHKEDKISKAFISRRKELKTEPNVNISDLLAAREDLLIIEKTSSAELVKNTKSAVNRVIIPNVPDRGGRPGEQRPPVEMPNWQKRSAGDGSNRGGGRGWGGGKKFKGSGGRGYQGGGRGRGRGSW